MKINLERIVCKRTDTPYKVTEQPSRYWIKVNNSKYTQQEGREELHTLADAELFKGHLRRTVRPVVRRRHRKKAASTPGAAK